MLRSSLDRSSLRASSSFGWNTKSQCGCRKVEKCDNVPIYTWFMLIPISTRSRHCHSLIIHRLPIWYQCLFELHKLQKHLQTFRLGHIAPCLITLYQSRTNPRHPHTHRLVIFRAALHSLITVDLDEATLILGMSVRRHGETLLWQNHTFPI